MNRRRRLAVLALCGLAAFGIAAVALLTPPVSADEHGAAGIEELSRAAKAPDSAARLRAVDGLIVLGSDEAAEELKAVALTDPEAEVREAAYIALYSIRKRDAAQLLLKCLKDTDSVIKPLCVRLLGKVRAGEAVYPLISLFVGADPVLQASIMQSLGQIGSTDALPFLGESLGGPLPNAVRVKAIEAMGLIVESTGAVASLKRELKTRDTSVRAAAALALAGLGNPAGLSVCIELLGHKDRAIRRQAAQALGEMEDMSSLKALEEALKKEKDPAVKKAALAALNRLKAKKR